MAALITHVSLFDDKGVLHSFGPGDEVPVWARKRITNPNVWDGEVEEHQDDNGGTGDGPPPQSGKGSGEVPWRLYAESKGVDVSGDAGRDDIIAACVKAGVPVE